MSPPSSPRVCKLPETNGDQMRDSISVVLESLQQRANITSVRSLFSCFGIGETTPFNLPAQERMMTRAKTNANYFLTNYVLLTVGVLVFSLCVFHPIQLLVCIAVAYGWHVFLTKKQPPTDKFVIFGRRLTEQDILLAATASTVVFLLFFILPTVIFSLSLSSLASAAHALLRNNRLKDDSIDARQSSMAAAEVEELV
ncbi:hypothetical protein BBJ29_001840 [Phytophthora kernoviae]|uniref:PRA1 family protein n=1 Tax=Phytophthora kernoviae TaxID=325452 RepID=A0A3F2RT16_9STRA|nr:hypothetical protein BBJ29_001840 [Phytophthora kernoviae]RLN62628.1 hypothetical protein BBP00_00004648 [Phytophthora kernoviae]